jgi:PTS system mannose-specific IIA component
MTGTIIITHGKLGEELLYVLEMITGKQENFETVSITSVEKVDETVDMIKKKIKEVDCGKGVLLLTDMFGGTPSNISLSFLESPDIEVVTGVNLPMLMKLVDSRDKMELKELANVITEYGKKSISVARNRLYSNKKE